MVTRLNICIPRINKRVTKKDVWRVFEKYRFGSIKSVVIGGERDSRCVFIDYYSWRTDVPRVKAVYDRLMEGKDIKIIYDTPWHWRCVKSRM